MESPERVRDHLIAFYAHHDAEKLRGDLKVHGLVDWTLRKGLAKLNKRLLKKYNDKISLDAKLGSPKERVLRLCLALTPEHTVVLIKKTLAFTSGNNTNADEGVQPNGSDKLMRDLYLFYLKVNKEKLQYLDSFVSFGMENGVPALNSVLRSRYGYDLSMIDSETNTEIDLNGIEMSDSEKRRKEKDPDLKQDVIEFMSEVDPEKVEDSDACEILTTWVEIIGRDKTNGIFVRIYGREMDDLEGGDGWGIPPLALRNQHNAPATAPIVTHSHTPSPNPFEETGTKRIPIGGAKRTASASTINSKFKGSGPSREKRKSPVANEKANSEMGPIGASAKTLGKPVRNRDTPAELDAGGNQEQQPDALSYLDSPALFLRNIPNVSVSAKNNNRLKHKKKRSHRKRVDYDDDSREKKATALPPRKPTVAELQDIMDRKEAPKNKPAHNKGIEASGVNLLSKQDSINESSWDVLLGNNALSPNSEPAPNIMKKNSYNTPGLLKLFKTTRVLGTGVFGSSSALTPAKAGNKKITTAAFDDFKLEKVEDKLRERPANISVKSAAPIRPNFESVALPAEVAAGTLSARIRFIRGSDNELSPEEREEKREEINAAKQMESEARLYNLNVPLPLPLANSASNLARFEPKRATTAPVPVVEATVIPSNTNINSIQTSQLQRQNSKNRFNAATPNFIKRIVKKPNRNIKSLNLNDSSRNIAKPHCIFEECTEKNSLLYGKCVNCGLEKNLHIGESFDVTDNFDQERPCLQFVGKGNLCDRCNHAKMSHQWYAFDVPKQLLASNKNLQQIPGEATPLSDNEI